MQARLISDLWPRSRKKPARKQTNTFLSFTLSLRVSLVCVPASLPTALNWISPNDEDLSLYYRRIGARKDLQRGRMCTHTHTQTRIQSPLLDSVGVLISSCGPLLTPPSLFLSLLSPPLSLWQLCLCSCHLQFQLLFITSPLTPADTHTRTHSVSSMRCHGSWDTVVWTEVELDS